MQIRPLVLALSLILGAGLPAMAAKKYKAPKHPHVRTMKPRKATKAAVRHAKAPKRPKVKVQKHHKNFA